VLTSTRAPRQGRGTMCPPLLRTQAVLGRIPRFFWKKKPAEPCTNRPVGCPVPGCKLVVWSRYLENHIEIKHEGCKRSKAVEKQIDSSKPLLHERAYTRALFEAQLRHLTCLCAGQGGKCKKGCQDKV